MLAYRRCPAPLDSKPPSLHETQCGSHERGARRGVRGIRPRRRPIGTLFVGTAVSRIGDSITLVALIWIMFERTQSAGGVALVQFAYTILVPVGGLLVGGVHDRFRVVPVMIGDAFVKSAVVGLAVLALLAEADDRAGAGDSTTRRMEKG